MPDLKELLRAPCTAGLSVSSACSHFCRYCMVENKAAELGVPWRMKALPLGPVLEAARAMSGETVQLPVTHDIVPTNVGAVAAVIAELLPRNNRVVVVTKPFEVCVDKLTSAFPSARQSGALSFRVSVSSDDAELLRRWEPGAPLLEERMRVLKKLSAGGWRVGASIAPMLDIPNAVRLFRSLEPYCTDTIYVAKMAQGDKLRPRGRLTAADIETLRSQCADVRLLAEVHAQLARSPLFSPKFCAAEYDPWAFGSESAYYDRLKNAYVAGLLSAEELSDAQDPVRRKLTTF